MGPRLSHQQCFFSGTFPGIFRDFLVAAQKVRDFFGKILDFFQDRLEKSVQKRFRNTRKLHLVMKNTVWRRLRRAKVENKVKTRFWKVWFEKNPGLFKTLKKHWFDVGRIPLQKKTIACFLDPHKYPQTSNRSVTPVGAGIHA